jgi:probable rRNA maturation factor
MPTRRAPKRPNSARVAVQFTAPFRDAPSAALLRKWARAAARGPVHVTLRIVGPAESRRLNHAYRQKNHPTNVLTFSYGDAARTGDIVLCHALIAREARAQHKTVQAHYAHLVVHGMLHLRGLDHASSGDAERMERAEIRILRRFGLSNPYTVG